MPLLPPNHTQVPNIVFDEFMPKMAGSELKVFLAICRKTIGWHKETDSISYSQIEKMTGLRRAAVCSAVKTLEDVYQIIIVDRAPRRTSKYTVRFENRTTIQHWFENQPTTGLIISPDFDKTGLKSEKTKESVKEKKEKENVPSSSSKDQFYDLWSQLYFNAHGRKYKSDAGDWKQVHSHEVLSIDWPKLEELVRAWFAVPATGVRFYRHKIASFASSLDRAEALIQVSNHPKEFAQARGWGEG